MADVARLAGVSMMTVSRAYQGLGKVSPDARARIEAAAAQLGYVPNRAAAQLSSSRSRVIGAIIPPLSHSLFGNTLEGLSGPMRRADHQLLLAECGPSPEEEMRAVSTLLGYRPDGLVVIAVELGEDSRRLVGAAGIPVVETWDLDHAPLDMAAGFSNRAAARRMTEHLIGLGRRRIGYVDVPAPRAHRLQQRRLGFVEAMEEAGLSADLVLEPGEGPSGLRRGREAVRRLLEREPAMDALFCANDGPAAGALLECQALGIAVPDRLAIGGFGDFDIAPEIPPGLTTIRLHARAIGQVAGEMVLARLAGESEGPGIRDLGFELVRRGSA